MKIYSYESNIINVSNGKNIVVLATSKKEALKFAKDYEGLTIGSKVKGSSKEITYSIDDLMNIQSNLLDGLLKKKIVELSTI